MLGELGDFGRCGLALTQRFAHRFDDHWCPDRTTVAEHVDDRLGDIIDRDRGLPYHVIFDIRRLQYGWEADDPHGGIGNARAPVLLAQRHPDMGGELAGQAVEGQRRGKADDAPGDQFGYLRQRVLLVGLRIGESA